MNGLLPEDGCGKTVAPSNPIEKVLEADLSRG